MSQRRTCPRKPRSRKGCCVESGELRRSLSLPLITLYGIGTIVGGGVYALLGKVAGEAGTAAPLSFVLAALVAAFSACSFAALSARFPVSGGRGALGTRGVRRPLARSRRRRAGGPDRHGLGGDAGQRGRRVPRRAAGHAGGCERLGRRRGPGARGVLGHHRVRAGRGRDHAARGRRPRRRRGAPRDRARGAPGALARARAPRPGARLVRGRARVVPRVLRVHRVRGHGQRRRGGARPAPQPAPRDPDLARGQHDLVRAGLRGRRARRPARRARAEPPPARGHRRRGVAAHPRDPRRDRRARRRQRGADPSS